MKTSEQTDKLWPAIVKARQAMKGPKKDSTNPHFKSKYADLAACIDAADDAGAPHGLVTLQELTSDAAGVSVATIIVHESGQWLQMDPLFIPANKQDAQGFGSAASYSRRYSIKAAWNMADEDDDGNAAVATTKPAQTVTNHAIGEPSSAGYYRVIDYKKDGAFHTASVLGADSQGGAIKVATKLSAVGKELAVLADGKTECKVDMTPKGRGEAWLNSIKSRAMAEGAPQLVSNDELDASSIPF